MRDYKSIFTQLLREDMPVNVSPPKNQMSDSDYFSAANPDFEDNPELANKFETDGVSVDMAQEYMSKIQSWQGNLEQADSVLKNIYEVAAKNADDPGAGEIYSSIGSLIEGMLTDLGTLSGHLKTLGHRVQISMKRDRAKQMGGK